MHQNRVDKRPHVIEYKIPMQEISQCASKMKNKKMMLCVINI